MFLSYLYPILLDIVQESSFQRLSDLPTPLESQAARKFTASDHFFPFSKTPMPLFKVTTVGCAKEVRNVLSTWELM